MVTRKFPMGYPSRRGVLFIKLETPVYHREERALIFHDSVRSREPVNARRHFAEFAKFYATVNPPFEYF